MGRGMLTGKIELMANDFFGMPIDQKQLRLIPYLFDCCINHANVDGEKLDRGEITCMNNWALEGHIKFHDGRYGQDHINIEFSEEFWDFSCAILWESYAFKKVKVCDG